MVLRYKSLHYNFALRAEHVIHHSFLDKVEDGTCLVEFRSLGFKVSIIIFVI